MKLYTQNETYKLYEGNMLDLEQVIKSNSIGAIVCDPPYELNFMGKQRDNSGIAFKKETWEHCFKVLKPGGYLLAFGGTRTYHRIACAIEDAGFEIKDCIMWLYGSGFPKSMNIGLAIDKKNGIKSIDTGIPSPNARPNGTKENTLYKSGTVGKNFNIKIAQNKFAGYGTCLKPAYEPIIVARKPFKTSVAENIMQNGVGGINIDECRIPLEKNYEFKTTTRNKRTENNVFDDNNCGFDSENNTNASANEKGRFPANVIHDGSEEAIEAMGEASRYFYCAKASKKDRDEGLDLFETKTKVFNGKSNEPSKEMKDVEKRFTTQGKNIHPTVKPTELMQYLVRLVTPKGETILDPFMGSGSTGKAIMFENRERNADYKFIGIELTSDYLTICQSRINYALHTYEYENKKVEKETGQLHLNLLEENK